MTRYFISLLLLSCLAWPGMGWAGELASDNFNRADGGLGANWTTMTGADGPQIVTNQVQPLTVGVLAQATYSAITWPDNQYAQVSIMTMASDADREGGVILRGTTAGRTNYQCRVAGPLGATATLSIYRFNAGAPTLLVGTGANQTVNSGDVLYCEIQGSTLTMKINGATVLGPTVDGSPIASGSAGIYTYSNGTVVQSKVDTWSGGDFAGGAGNGSLMLMGVGR